MFGRNGGGKKRPAEDKLGVYHVQVTREELNFDSDLISDIASEVGASDTWPSMSLDVFNKFTKALQQQVAQATGEIISIGDISYLTIDQNSRKPSETGLSWDNAEVRADMENFVIETANQVFNDEDVRVDESISYDMLKGALATLISAAQKLTDLSEGDLPVLPTVDEYTNAVETNQQIKVLPRKLVEGPQTVNLTTPEIKHEEPIKEPVVEVSKPEIVPDSGVVQPVMSSVAPIVPTAAIAVSSEEKPELEKPAEQMSSNNAPVPEKNHVAEPSDELIVKSMIKQLEAKPQLFVINEALLNKTVAPEDEAFVDVMMAREQQIANGFMIGAAEKMTAKAQQQLLKNTAALSLNNESIDKLLASNWQDTIIDRIKQKRTQTYADTLSTTKQNLQDNYEFEIEQERLRHEQTLAQLKQKFDSDITNAVNQSESSRDQVIRQDSELALEQQKVYIDKEVVQLKQQVSELVKHRVLDAVISREGWLAEAMQEQFDQMQQELSANRQQFVAEHVKAMETRQAADIAQTQKLHAETAGKNISALEMRKSALESEKLTLQQDLNRVSADSSKWQTEAENSHSENERLIARISEMTSSDNQTALIAALSSRNGSEVSTAGNKQNHGFVKGMLTSAAVLIGVGGVGYATYHVHQADIKAEESIKAAESKFNAKQVVLENSLKKAQQNNGSSVNTDTSAVSSVDTKFATLDADIAKGSLNSYYQNFENMNLESEDRTYCLV